WRRACGRGARPAERRRRRCGSSWRRRGGCGRGCRPSTSERCRGAGWDVVDVFFGVDAAFVVAADGAAAELIELLFLEADLGVDAGELGTEKAEVGVPDQVAAEEVEDPLAHLHGELALVVTELGDLPLETDDARLLPRDLGPLADEVLGPVQEALRDLVRLGHWFTLLYSSSWLSRFWRASCASSLSGARATTRSH